jgi:hypothetical protein
MLHSYGMLLHRVTTISTEPKFLTGYSKLRTKKFNKK